MAPPALSPLARRPLLSAAVCLIAGILLHPSLPSSPTAWLTVTLVALTLAFVRPSAVAPPALAFAILCLGVAAAQLHRSYFAAHDVATFTADPPRLAELEIRLDQPP